LVLVEVGFSGGANYLPGYFLSTPLLLYSTYLVSTYFVYQLLVTGRFVYVWSLALYLQYTIPPRNVILPVWPPI
jgi:hypothetical protein